MTTLNPALVVLSAVLVGSIIGYIFGFAVASHADVLEGVRPRTNNKFLLFIARPTADFKWWEGIMFAIAMLAWIPIFFGLCAVPALIGNGLAIDDPMIFKVTYVIFGCVLFFARRFGAKVWRNLV